MACSSGRLIRRLSSTDSSSLMAASAIPTIVSASVRVSSRSEVESPDSRRSRSWCSLRCCMKSLMPTGRDYIRSGAGLEEDLARYLARALLAGVILGESPGSTPQERWYPGDLLQRAVGPPDVGLAGGLPFLMAERLVEGVGENARAGVAHQRSLHEGPVGGGWTEGEEGHFEGFGHALFQVRSDDEVGLRGLDAGCDRFRIILRESAFGEAMRVEQEVSFEVREVGAAGDDLQPDLAGQGVAETEGVGEVPEDGDLAVLEGLRRFQARVPGELRRAGELGPDRALHGFGVELAQLADGPQGGARPRGPDHRGRHPWDAVLVLQVERRGFPDLPVEEQVGPRAGETAQVPHVSPQRHPGVDLDPDQVQQPLGLRVLGRRTGREDGRPEEVDRGVGAPVGSVLFSGTDQILQRELRGFRLLFANSLPGERHEIGASRTGLGEGLDLDLLPREQRRLRAGHNYNLRPGVTSEDPGEVAEDVPRRHRVPWLSAQWAERDRSQLPRTLAGPVERGEVSLAR